MNGIRRQAALAALCMGTFAALAQQDQEAGRPPAAEMQRSAARQQRASAEAVRESVLRQWEAVQEMLTAAFLQKQAAAAQRASFAPLWKPLPATAAAVDAADAAPPIRPNPPEFPCDPLPPEVWSPLVRAASEREGLAVDLLTAVIRQESAFRPCAVSPKGAMGLMQLMPATAQLLGVKDPFDPKENVDAGARFLKMLLSRYGGNLALALGAYNAGPGRVDAAGGVPPIPETQDYVSDILTKLAEQSVAAGR
ncbi:MAG: lytic transglycosylase domain-containing protein [Bryobacteraceae bacterium]|nr:lytic transglycosylase domain-containing protein [Bryobacteraceae bacterium]